MLFQRAKAAVNPPSFSRFISQSFRSTVYPRLVHGVKSTITRPPTLSSRSFAMSSATDAPKASRSHKPDWVRPTKTLDSPVLKVYNSLTRSKDEFIPTKGNQVNWYNCGPTVYDASHMGHARNYLTQDIVRRILQDYFRYDVNFVMNITDIDDKIIIRARESYLLRQTIAQNPKLTPELLEDAKIAFGLYVQSNLVKALPSPISASSDDPYSFAFFDAVLAKDQADEEWAKAGREKEEKFGMYLTSLSNAAQIIREAEKKIGTANDGEEAVQELVEGTADVLGPFLGDKLGDTIQDPVAVSRELATYWEERFFDDMEHLNIIRPDRITRVSEYIPENVAFIQRIIDNGFAYEGGGSIWFDVAKFDGAEGDGFRHEYAKLQPGSKGNKKLLDDGEGALTGSQGKRQPADFALWKAKSKPGEPSWPSPWGEGRPGWHIECSVMASAILGSNMDIHSGGVDLMFPHHDNELAQSEAYHGCRQWVNYFLHTGHLHIEGLKMSKSLKNFITIEEALRDYSARQLRLAFMLQTWNAKMDFKRDLIQDVRTKEETIDNFFTNVKARIAQAGPRGPSPLGTHGFDEPERSLTADFHKAQYDFRVALCDSFNTPQAIIVIMDLIGKTNIYFATGRKSNVSLIENIAVWISEMLRMFGLSQDSNASIGWGKAGESAAGGADFEERLNPYVKAIASFRDEIRQIAIEGGSSKDILALCDRFRDQDLVNLGVQLDDGQGADGGALYKLVDPAVLIRAREEKAQAAADKAAKKAANAAAAEAKRIATLEKGRASPLDMFKPPHVPEGLYTAWDETGLPTKDAEGNELSKGAAKKCAKEQKIQEKAHAAFLDWQKEGGK